MKDERPLMNDHNKYRTVVKANYESIYFFNVQLRDLPHRWKNQGRKVNVPQREPWPIL